VEDAAYAWLQNLSYPCSYMRTILEIARWAAGSSESNDDIRARPLASDYDGTDIYVALHSNGYTGDCTGSCPTGSEAYYDSTRRNPPPARRSPPPSTPIMAASPATPIPPGPAMAPV